MNIVFFTEAYLPFNNGVVNSILLLQRELERMGHSTFVFTTGETPLTPKVFTCPKFEVSQGYGISFPIYSDQARRVLAQADIFHTHQPFTLGFYALLQARKYNKPLILTSHTQYEEYARYVPYIGQLSRSAARGIAGGLMRQCDKIILPSKSYKQTLCTHFGVPAQIIKIIPNCFEPGNTTLKRAKSPALRGKKVLVYCGRLAPEKNLPFLIRSFHKVHKAEPSAFLVLIGGGPMLEELQAYTQRLHLTEAVQFKGQVDRTAVYDLLSSGDLFTSTSLSEVLPLTLLEAMHIGVVPVTFASPGFKDIITHRKNGWIVSTQTEDAYAREIIKLLSNPKQIHHLSLEAKKKSQEFLPSRIVPKVISLYHQALHEKGIQGGR